MKTERIKIFICTFNFISAYKSDFHLYLRLGAIVWMQGFLRDDSPEFWRDQRLWLAQFKKIKRAKFQTLSYKLGLFFCSASCCDSLHV